jgi:putative aldouronate transport system permease protein
MRPTVGEKVFKVINSALLSIIALVTLYPLAYVLSASFSSSAAFRMGRVFVWPVDVTADAYAKVLFEPSIWQAYANTIFYTVAGTLISMAFTVLGAYPLSKRYLPGRRALTQLIVFTMWFAPGIIPFYMTLRDYGLLNSRLGILLPFAVSAFNLILLKNFFDAVPSALEEAAKIDGAGDMGIMLRIFLPLSMPALATVGLFYAVSRWNGYFWAMVIFQDDGKIPLQVLLKKLITDVTQRTQNASVDMDVKYTSETIIYATIVVSTAPMMLVYPYIQKYFVKGVMIGSVKE